MYAGEITWDRCISNGMDRNSLVITFIIILLKLNCVKLLSQKQAHFSKKYDSMAEVRKNSKGHNDKGLRIFNGQPVPEGVATYVVFIISLLNNTRCTGSLVTGRIVMTAGHCAKPLMIVALSQNNLELYVEKRVRTPYERYVGDEFGVEESLVSEYAIHPDYEEWGIDVALLMIRSPFMQTVPFVKIATVKEDILFDCISIGYGVTQDPETEFTQRYFKNKRLDLVYFNDPVPDQICFVHGDVNDPPAICRGDSGGPLVCHNFIWGIAAFGNSEVEC
ncbi:Prostatic glandular kallikrein-8 precursor, putative [Pediculus humanus corporis]|uniref:Prostatic glandular kallikrein-8, putative n=1 Tax=Pediculus humanus subsp. corporis TaxID=121224 RepID=E0VML5_PEDHC|nr:Prostatic glandular kallikrein-8 precursor, putative [Pediculus humanus corporis]EEB14621.1 Prostatic glandular kallikrein-8 precursor, putative [Pediculus humanus corporis]